MPPKVPYIDLDPWLWPWTQPIYEQLNFRHNLTFDLIVTLILGVGT